METITANLTVVLVIISAVIALAIRAKERAGYTLALYVLLSCTAILLIDFAFFDITTAAEWHAIAITKICILSPLAAYLADIGGGSRWWLAIMASLSIDFVGNFAALYGLLFMGGAPLGDVYYFLCIATAFLEGIAAHGVDRLAGNRDVCNYEPSRAG